MTSTGRTYEEFEFDDGYVFRFLFDKDIPEQLHIEVNGYDVDQAIDIFDNGEPALWRTDRNCYETLKGNRGIWWNELNGNNKHILIWSCFTRYRR